MKDGCGLSEILFKKYLEICQKRLNVPDVVVFRCFLLRVRSSVDELVLLNVLILFLLAGRLKKYWPLSPNTPLMQ